MYKGCPCVKNELKFKNVSLSENEKFEKVTGNNKSAEANIAGVLHLLDLSLKANVMTLHHTFYFPFVSLDNLSIFFLMLFP